MPVRSFNAPQRALVIVLAVGLVGMAAVPGLAGSHEERRLSDQAARLAEVREQITAAEDDVALSAQDVTRVQAQLATVVDAVRAAEESVQRSQQAVADADGRLGVAIVEQDEQRRVAGDHAAQRYMRGGDVSLQAVLTADTAAEVLDQSLYLEAVARSDRQSGESLDAAKTRVEAEQQALAAEEVSLLRVQEQQRQILAEVEALRDEQALVLAADTAQLDELQASESILERDLQAMEELARQASAAASPAPSAAASAGPSAGSPPPPPPPEAGADGWIWPVRGTVTSEFGQRWGRLHAGIDIAAPGGTPIYAAQAGCVSFAGVQGGYGNMILIDHGGGTVTAYAHQSRLGAAKGDCVSTGQQIGAVGSTGNSTGNHLHFEVRVNGSARNPRPYLP